MLPVSRKLVSRQEKGMRSRVVPVSSPMTYNRQSLLLATKRTSTSASSHHQHSLWISSHERAGPLPRNFSTPRFVSQTSLALPLSRGPSLSHSISSHTPSRHHSLFSNQNAKSSNQNAPISSQNAPISSQNIMNFQNQRIMSSKQKSVFNLNSNQPNSRPRKQPAQTGAPHNFRQFTSSSHQLENQRQELGEDTNFSGELAEEGEESEDLDAEGFGVLEGQNGETPKFWLNIDQRYASFGENEGEDAEDSALTTSKEGGDMSQDKEEPFFDYSIDTWSELPDKPHSVFIDGTYLVHKSKSYIEKKRKTKVAQKGTQAVEDEEEKIEDTPLFRYTDALLKFQRQFIRCAHICVVIDTQTQISDKRSLFPNFKKDMIQSIQSEDFSLYIEAAQTLALNPITSDNHEASDLIAAQAQHALNQGHRVTIVAQDADLLQLLVSEDIQIYQPDKKNFVRQADIKEKYQVEPQQLPDYFALLGNKPNNLTGVSGIKAPSVIKLLADYGSVTNILKIMDTQEECEDKLIEKCRKHHDQLKINYQMCQLPPIEPPPIEDFKRLDIDAPDLIEFLEKQSFPPLIDRFKREEESIENGSFFRKPWVPAFILPSEWEQKFRPESVTLVRDPETAQRVAKQLMTLTDRIHACDTETVGVDLKKSPFGQGKIICFSIYCGSDVDFGSGARVWVDNWEECEGLLEYFKEYFECKEIKKVWHNYSFDRAVLANNGVLCKGFGGDTMQMARLWDTSRIWKGGYSLQGLSNDLLQQSDDKKRSMIERFGSYNRRRDGSLGKITVMPEIAELQRNPDYIKEWIDYSTLDTEATWKVYQELKYRLQQMPWEFNQTNMFVFYQHEWLPFGELLTEIEYEGIKVDVQHLKTIEKVAWKEYSERTEQFKQWASKYCKGAHLMNTDSDLQKQQLFFAPMKNRKTGEMSPKEKTFRTPNTEGFIEEGKKIPKKTIPFSISGFGWKSKIFTKNGWPAANTVNLRWLAGSPEKNQFGTAMNYFKKEENGKEACRAIDSLLVASATQTLIHTFISPMQNLVDKNSRVHTSINLNTETGRLSSRRPNLQNQPALEKDKYKIRAAFTAGPGKNLIVSDYGQLELRLLGHITNCKSMIEAFASGGDFHSRTAVGMYDEIKEAIARGEVVLEGEGEGKVSVKDKYASQRRVAKVLNFSIAYGKTAIGLSKDWGVTEKEAQETLERWYSDRPEVREWQLKTIQTARETGYTRTLLGRYRRLPNINARNKYLRTHSERAAINTPLQGGAADIVGRAMVLLRLNERLEKMGWKQVMQVHDEIILEGPKESTDEALQIVIKTMERPFEEPLLVDLVVDANAAENWYLAK